MGNLFLLAVVVIIGVIVLAIFKGKFESLDEGKRQYRYQRHKFFLTRAEHECFDALMEAVGNDYLIFAQVHLPTLVDHRVVGQNWRGAFRHISEKSVDFVLCDKAYISPKLAIELDDKTHERPDRQERDKEVERILQDAGMPLLRLTNHGRFNPTDLSQRIKEALTNNVKH